MKKTPFSLINVVVIFCATSLPPRARATEGAYWDNRGADLSPAATNSRWKGLVGEGSAAMGIKRYDVAIRFFSAALDLRPSEAAAADICRLRGRAYFKHGERDKALADYDRALRFSPKTAGDYFVRGSVYERKGNYRAAASDYAKAAEMDAEEVETLNSIAWLRATAPVNELREAREALRLGAKVCELTRWRDADYLDTLAAAHAEARNFEQAIKYEEQAIKLAPREQRQGKEDRLLLYRQHKPHREPVGLH